MARRVLSLFLRTAITLFAFWWIFQKVDLGLLRETLRSADPAWLLAATLIFFLAQLGCVWRWSYLVPSHPLIRFPFLLRSFLVASFFSAFLPTTVGGDVVRGYDLIKVTGEWRQSLASVLVDRLLGLVGFLCFALVAWFLLPVARQDPLVRGAFLGFCGLVVVTFAVLGSRRVLRAMLKPFGKIGLGQLQSHAGQFQEALRDYAKRPRQLLRAFGVTLGVQILGVLVYAAVSRALHLPVPLLYLILVVPVILTVSQVPVSLNGWGIREGATVLFLQRVEIDAAQALSLSLICAVIPLIPSVAGAILFLAKRRGRKAG